MSLFYAALAILTSRGSIDQRSSRSPRPRGAIILEPRVWKADLHSWTRRAYDPPQLFAQSPRIAQFLDQLLNLILRDFVIAWYSKISRDPCFPNEVDRAIRLALTDLLDRLDGVDLAEVVTARLVPIFTAHLRDFHAAEVAVRGRKLNRSVTESEELDLAIASKFRDGKLHPAASLSFPDTKLIQQDYIRGIVQDTILPGVLSRGFLASRAVSSLVREIVACAVLSPVMQALTDPDTWNQLMENFGRIMLQDRSTVRKLRAALDQHASPTPKSGKSTSFPRLLPGDSERKFEKFIRAARKTNNLSDARRFRSEVSSQLKKDSLEDNQDQVYLRRLEMGKRILDQKVHQLAAGGSRRAPLQPPPLPTTSSSTARLENASLVEILKDASALSYFMEYMDRQKKMSQVQFWLVVDGFRNPLEDDGQDDDQSSATLAMWTSSDRNDLRQIDEAYLSKPGLGIPSSVRGEVQEFLAAGKSATRLQYHRARKAILAAQTAVLEEMDSKHLHSFKKSDLFYKCLASQEVSTSQLLPTTGSLTVNQLAPQGSSVSRPQSTRPTPHPVTRLAPKLGSSDGKRSNSTSDLRGLSPSRNALDARISPRASLDEDSPSPLFDEDDGNDDLVDSVQSLDQNGGPSAPDNQVVQAVEQALNTIMDDERPQSAEDLRASLFGNGVEPESQSLFSGDVDSHKESAERERPLQHTKEAERPNLQSLGLVSASSRIGVFVDDDLFADEDEYLPDDEGNFDDSPVDSGEDEVHEAAPGDLGLAEAITLLTNDINKLVAQEAVVESLTKKADLTNNMTELRILRKSKASLQREIRRKELQRQQYIIQESDNSLYGRSTVRIKSIRVGKEADGREFAVYVVEVQRNAGEQMPAAAWSVTRRYSEFHELHQKLRSLYPSVRGLDFPRRRMVMKFQREFLHKRRIALENYLRELLLLPEVCRSRELRAFLSQSVIAQGQDVVDREGGRDMITRLYDSVADGVDDILGNIPVLDQLSVAGQNLIAAATNQLNAMPAGGGDDSITTAEAEAELNAFENKELEPFIKPICDIFLEVFELNRGNNWLRGRAVVVVLQQLLGGTIERKVRENVKLLVQEDTVLRYLGLLKDNLWPGGEFDRNRRSRTAQEKTKSRTEASLMLATLVPDLAGGVVGRVNAQAASRRIFATFNNARLK